MCCGFLADFRTGSLSIRLWELRDAQGQRGLPSLRTVDATETCVPFRWDYRAGGETCPRVTLYLRLSKAVLTALHLGRSVYLWHSLFRGRGEGGRRLATEKRKKGGWGGSWGPSSSLGMESEDLLLRVPREEPQEDPTCGPHTTVPPVSGVVWVLFGDPKSHSPPLVNAVGRTWPWSQKQKRGWSPSFFTCGCVASVSTVTPASWSEASVQTRGPGPQSAGAHPSSRLRAALTPGWAVWRSG